MMITGLNHITLAIRHMETSFSFYKDVLGFTPLCQWEGSAYFIAGVPENPGCVWFCLDLDRPGTRVPSSCPSHIAFSVDAEHFQGMSAQILASGAPLWKENTSPGESLYFLDPDNHKLEIHAGNWQERLKAKKADPGKWRDITWFV